MSCGERHWLRDHLLFVSSDVTAAGEQLFRKSSRRQYGCRVHESSGAWRRQRRTAFLSGRAWKWIDKRGRVASGRLGKKRSGDSNRVCERAGNVDGGVCE